MRIKDSVFCDAPNAKAIYLYFYIDKVIHKCRYTAYSVGARSAVNAGLFVHVLELSFGCSHGAHAALFYI